MSFRNLTCRLFCISLIMLLYNVLLPDSLLAQQNGISIRGLVKASDDQQPVPQASVSIWGKGVGTSTNISGQFALIIPAANLGDSLRISCVGFNTKQIAVSSLKNNQSVDIMLQPNTTQLKEVTVTYYDPDKIIRKAIERIGDNYIDHPHILRGFYRTYAYAGDNPLQLSEMVFDVYNYGYADKHADLFKLIKARNEKNDRDFKPLEISLNPNTIFVDDIVNHRTANGFLSDAGLARHQFEVRGVVEYQGYQAYQIVFKEKPGMEDETFRGTMYIDTKTYAFIRFEFGLSPSSMNTWGNMNPLSHTLVRKEAVDIDLKKDRYTVNYQMVGHQWVLAGMTADDQLSFKTPDATKDQAARLKFNYQVTAVDTVAKDSFSGKLGRFDSINQHAGSTDAGFWDSYNIVLSDVNAENVFRQIDEVNKQAKDK